MGFFFNKQWRHNSGDIVSIMIKYADEGCGTSNGHALSMPFTEADDRLL